jgi:hypothetical protein
MLKTKKESHFNSNTRPHSPSIQECALCLGEVGAAPLRPAPVSSLTALTLTALARHTRVSRPSTRKCTAPCAALPHSPSTRSRVDVRAHIAYVRAHILWTTRIPIAHLHRSGPPKMRGRGAECRATSPSLSPSLPPGFPPPFSPPAPTPTPARTPGLSTPLCPLQVGNIYHRRTLSLSLCRRLHGVGICRLVSPSGLAW